MFALLMLMTVMASAADKPKAPMKSVCDWVIKGASPEQQKKLDEMKKAAKCPEVKK